MGEFTKINAGPFVEFLNNVSPPLLGCTKDDISKHLTTAEVVNFIKHWIADEQDISLFVSRMAVEKDDDKVQEKKDASPEDSGSREYRILVEDQMPDHQRQASTIAFLKRAPASFRGIYEGTDPQTNGTQADAAGAGAAATPAARPGNFVVQLQVLSLDWLDVDTSPYEVVDCYLQYAFTPLFNALQYRGQG